MLQKTIVFRNKEYHSCHRKGRVSSHCNGLNNRDGEKKSRGGSKKNHRYGKKQMEKRMNKLERKSDNEENRNEISNESTDSDIEYLSHIRCISGNQHKFYREIML